MSRLESPESSACMVAADEELLTRVVDLIVREVQPLQIWLFGSRARGDARPDSDLDLLIVERGPFDRARSRRAELVRLWESLGDISIPKDLLLFTPEELDHWRGAVNHVIARALREGRLIYEQQ